MNGSYRASNERTNSKACLNPLNLVLQVVLEARVIVDPATLRHVICGCAEPP